MAAAVAEVRARDAVGDDVDDEVAARAHEFHGAGEDHPDEQDLDPVVGLGEVVDGHEAHDDVGDEHHEDACERERAHGARRDGDAAVGRLEKVHDGGHQGTHLAKPSESSGMKATRIATMIMMRT